MSSTVLVRGFGSLWRASQIVLDLVALVVSGALAHYVHALLAARPTPASVYLPWLPIFLATQCALFAVTGMYRREKHLLNVRDYRALLISLAVGFFVLSTMVLWSRELAPGGIGGVVPELESVQRRMIEPGGDRSLSRFVIVLTFALAFPMVAFPRALGFRILRSCMRRGIGDRLVALAGLAEDLPRLRRAFERSPVAGSVLAGCFVPTGAPCRRALSMLGRYADIVRVARERGFHAVWFSSDPRGDEEARHEAAQLHAAGVEVVFAFEVPRGFRQQKGPGELVWLARRPGEGPLREGLKRALDLVLGGVILLLLAPVIFLLAVLVRLESPGPALIRQWRIGRHGRAFRMWKLRTMRAGEEPSGAGGRKRHRDPRVTAIGRWLRRLSLDELPQLLNVLAGDMSLVGPRPELPHIVEGYDPRARERLAAKPGITGMWQISPARRRPIHEELDYDLYYLHHRDVWLDLTILLLTIYAVLRGRGAR